MLLILGSVNADLLFKVDELPRPGETVLCPSYTMAPGGKGANQAVAASKAGAETRFVGHLGADGYGPVVRGILEEAGIGCQSLAISDKPTAVAVIGVDKHAENSIIVASGANLDTHAGQIADDDLKPGVTVLCQNEIRIAETASILKRAQERGARTILNLAPASEIAPEILDTLDVFIVNEIEARMVAQDQAAPLEAVARGLAQDHDLICVVTLGAAGAMAVGRREAWKVGSLPVDAVDTTGAGDAFAGILAAALDAGMSMRQALHRAAVGAAMSCEAIGAQSAQPKEAAIEARLAELAEPSAM